MNYISPLVDNTLPGVERRADLSPRELLEDYVRKSRPVVLTDAVKGWRALEKWTPEFFKERYGKLTKEIKGRTYSIAEQADWIMRSTEENPAPYPFNLNIEHYFPELVEDLRPQTVFDKVDRLLNPMMPKMFTKGTIKHEIFLGGLGSYFPILHVDVQSLHTQITQVYGSKEFFLYAPDQTPYMYPKPDRPLYSGVDNIFAPDLQQYPDFAKAKCHKVMLEAGDTVFFPTGWWHTTRSPGPSISYGRALVDRTNWGAYLDDTYRGWKAQRPLMAAPAMALCKVIGGAFNAMEAMRY
ncbi:MAG: cupin-like domain-containing protein [Flavobacteriales bacterium]|nr:cupin-like domain-containing protein [Flavobacteriales bacterium]MCB9193541.1 cupin-like domain-containing protein [Flavobacteriales bacterium]